MNRGPRAGTCSLLLCPAGPNKRGCILPCPALHNRMQRHTTRANLRSGPHLSDCLGASRRQLREQADPDASRILRVERLHGKGPGCQGTGVGLEPAQGAVSRHAACLAGRGR